MKRHNIITLLHCVLVATPQYSHGDPERALHHACQNIIGSSVRASGGALCPNTAVVGTRGYSVQR